MNCTNCRRELDVGNDVWSLHEGVIGTRGVVPLADPEVFCSEACLRAHFDEGENVATLARRIP